MPELPEVETVVRGLRVSLPGRSILDVRLGKTDFIDDPVALGEQLPGSRISDVTRLGKFISIDLIPCAPESNLRERFYLVIHLGMTGQLMVRAAGDPVPPHTHVFFALDDGRELRYTDIRRFGRILLVPESRVAAFRDHLGAEPLEITLEEFRARFGSRRARVKALLLDQGVLRGVGNIYADESLFRARIHPARLAGRPFHKGASLDCAAGGCGGTVCPRRPRPQRSLGRDPAACRCCNCRRPARWCRSTAEPRTRTSPSTRRVESPASARKRAD